MPKSYLLSEAEFEIITKAAETNDLNFFAGYWFKQEGEDIGFQFDGTFSEEDAWQHAFVTEQERQLLVAVTGVSTGKTLCIGMSSACYATLIPGFKFANVGRELLQAKMMYKAVLDMAKGTPFEKLIWNAPESPYPKIVIRWRYKNIEHEGTLEFFGLGRDADASNVFSWHGDRICLEEAYRIPQLLSVVSTLVTRLSGSYRERPYWCQIMVISNPAPPDEPNPDLDYLFDLGQTEPQNVLSISVESRKNRANTERQLAFMTRNMDDIQRQRFLEGKKVEKSAGYFSIESVNKCASKDMGDIIQAAVSENPGIIIKDIPYLGWQIMFRPFNPNFDYILVGDPGTDNAPARNSPCIELWNVTDYPQKPAELHCFWWGRGEGNINPFVETFMDLIMTHRPIIAAMDNTSTQKNMVQVINNERVTGKGYSVDGIIGLDFSSGKKYIMLSVLRIMLEAGRLLWPAQIKGMRQLIHYDPAKDKLFTGKVPNDVVATTSMGAFAIYRHFMGLEDDTSKDDPEANEVAKLLRLSLERRNARTARGPQAPERPPSRSLG